MFIKQDLEVYPLFSFLVSTDLHEKYMYNFFFQSITNLHNVTILTSVFLKTDKYIKCLS